MLTTHRTGHEKGGGGGGGGEGEGGLGGGVTWETLCVPSSHRDPLHAHGRSNTATHCNTVHARGRSKGKREVPENGVPLEYAGQDSCLRAMLVTFVCVCM